MNFGDWELFKMMIASLREHEMTTICKKNERNFKVDDFKRKLSSNTDKKGILENFEFFCAWNN